MRNVLIGIFIITFLVFFAIKSESPEQEYLQIHIQSNSFSRYDENIKQLVKEKVTSLLKDELELVSSKQELENYLKNKLNFLSNDINNFLKSSGCGYGAKVEFVGEYFEQGRYEGYVIESGVYDALKITLGHAQGNDYTCLLYPPLCLMEDENDVVLKSRIKKVIEKIFNKKENV